MFREGEILSSCKWLIILFGSTERQSNLLFLCIFLPLVDVAWSVVTYYMPIICNLLFCSEITVLLGAESNPCGAGAQYTIRCSTAEPAVFGARVAQQAADTTFQIPFQKKW